MSTVNPSTNNVRLGVCRIFWGGEDLGYTKGGVEVEIATNTSKLNVDQLGDAEIDEKIRGRTIRVKAPLAEHTLAILSRIMPASTEVSVGGKPATGTITIAVLPADGETIVVNGVTFTFRTSGSTSTEVTIGGTTSVTATNLASKLTASVNAAITVANYAAATNVVTVTYKTNDSAGNSYSLATGTAGADVVMSGAFLTGAVPYGRVDVKTGTGTSLLASAKALRLHPIEKSDTDYSEDVNIPKAATPGTVQFAYKLEDQRIFNVEFVGYPDPSQNYKLFSVGDPAAT